jgi:hypothetical protein
MAGPGPYPKDDTYVQRTASRPTYRLEPHEQKALDHLYGMDQVNCWIAFGNLFKHKKGGLYARLQLIRDADDGRERVLYKHLYPHPPGLWVRDKAEFEQADRFVLVVW